jgi:hypothetical protein
VVFGYVIEEMIRNNFCEGDVSIGATKNGVLVVITWLSSFLQD